jgi:ubiquinone/menaquinone biosynthesis C-methylase UbiE
MDNIDQNWYSEFKLRRGLTINEGDINMLLLLNDKYFTPYTGEITFRLMVRIQKKLDEISI